jgi:hypothetical protein
MFVDRDRFDGLPLHIHIPDLHGQVISRKDIAAIMGESDVRDGGDNFGKEGAG